MLFSKPTDPPWYKTDSVKRVSLTSFLGWATGSLVYWSDVLLLTITRPWILSPGEVSVVLFRVLTWRLFSRVTGLFPDVWVLSDAVFKLKANFPLECALEQQSRVKSLLAFQDSWASLLNTQRNRNIKNPWKELNKVKSIWNVSLSPGTENVRIANSHVSPKRNMTPPILIIMSTTAFLLNVLLLRVAVQHVWRIRTTRTHTKMTTLKSMMIIIGARKAPQKAPMWDRKQLHIKEINQSDLLY